ncbi:MAG TPA: hypothetical protein VHH36_06490 [Candidatus Thermoplasmatota archaeon]|nr:hypothetical protein [Candidatus Thermoplasmatota archaeon]
MFKPTLTVLVVAAVLAGCTSSQESANVQLPSDDDAIGQQSVTGSTGSVGGSVKNSPPQVLSVAPSATTGENRGAFTVVFTGAVKDRNTERQIASIAVSSTSPAALGGTHAVTNADTAATAEPAAFGADGFKVWTGTANDGVLNFKAQVVFPAFTPAGAYVFTATVADKQGESASLAAAAVAITSFSDITVNPTPVDAAGVALPGANWGAWEAEGGAQNVAATNYVKLVNTGDAPNARVVVDFDPAFRGAQDANFTIPVASNVQFAWFEDATPATTAPSEGTFSFQPANADGAITVAFTGKGNVIYLTYRIVQMPDVLPIQSYGISYTVTELPAL